jgi:hypothetical protein
MRVKIVQRIVNPRKKIPLRRRWVAHQQALVKNVGWGLPVSRGQLAARLPKTQRPERFPNQLLGFYTIEVFKNVGGENCANTSIGKGKRPADVMDEDIGTPRNGSLVRRQQVNGGCYLSKVRKFRKSCVPGAVYINPTPRSLKAATQIQTN